MKYIGFDIGGTKCAVCVGVENNNGIEILDKRSFPTESGKSPNEIIDRMCDAAQEMTDDFSHIGISCGGPLDSKNGVILSPPNLIGWDNVNICEYVRKRFGGKVSLQNDANACAVAEWKYGAGKGCQNMIFLTFGTGMGAGLILGGRLYSGTTDMAGEIGHVRISNNGPVGYGKQGSFEGFCSGGGIAQLAKTYALEKLQMGKCVSYCKSIDLLDTVTAKIVAACADEGNEDARQVYEICGQKLGSGLALLIDVLNPERIVIGSIFTRSEELLRKSMEKVLKSECLTSSLGCCEIVPSMLGEKLGDCAAVAVAAMDVKY